MEWNFPICAAGFSIAAIAESNDFSRRCFSSFLRAAVSLAFFRASSFDTATCLGDGMEAGTASVFFCSTSGADGTFVPICFAISAAFGIFPVSGSAFSSGGSSSVGGTLSSVSISATWAGSAASPSFFSDSGTSRSVQSSSSSFEFRSSLPAICESSVSFSDVLFPSFRTDASGTLRSVSIASAFSSASMGGAGRSSSTPASFSEEREALASRAAVSETVPGNSLESVSGSVSGSESGSVSESVSGSEFESEPERGAAS